MPSISVSVPHRYSHTAISIARLEDWKNSLALLQAALARLTPELLASLSGHNPSEYILHSIGEKHEKSHPETH